MDYSFIGATSSETTPIFEIRSNGGFQFPNYMSFLNNHRLLSPSEEYFDPPVYSTMSSDVLAQRLESVVEPMSVVENAARRVRRQRRQPPLPKTVEDLPSFLFSEEAIEEGFYRFDVTVQEKGKTLRHFAFMKNKQIKYLVKAKEIKIDSTFKVVKKPFYQLMSIQSIVNVGF